MKYVITHYIDANDGIPATVAPLRNGPALPSAELTVACIDYTQRAPLIVGTLPDSAAVPPSVTLIQKSQYDQRVQEHQSRQSQMQEGLDAQLLAMLADHRFKVETGGITVGGKTIKTDRESQAALNGTYQALSIPLVQSIDWKAADGWVTLTQADLRPVAEAVTRHVQSCFSAEKQVADQLNSGAQVEITSAFDAALADILAASAA